MKALATQYWPDVRGVVCEKCNRESYCGPTCRDEAWHRYVTFLDFCSSADNLCKQFGPRSGPTTCQSWSGSKPLDTLIWNILNYTRIHLHPYFVYASAGAFCWPTMKLVPLSARQPNANGMMFQGWPAFICCLGTCTVWFGLIVLLSMVNIFVEHLNICSRRHKQ